MAEELNSVETEQANTPPETGPETTSIIELENLLAQKDSELGLITGRIAELERSLEEANKKLADTNNSLSRAVASYRSMVVRSSPLVMEELISGDSIEDIDASLEKAKAMVARVRQGMVEEAGRLKVPAGAPQRTSIDLSALSPREKIQFAIGGKK